jgi:cytochrome c oxidase subunit 1
MLVFLGNLVWSLILRRRAAESNPWQSLSLEWQLPSPVPVHNFDRIPVISGDPYGYGENRGPVAAPVPSPAGGTS